MSIRHAPGVVVSTTLGALVVVATVAQQPAARAVAWTDLPQAVQRLLVVRGVDGERFDGYVRDVRARTQDRLREGDWEHLVYYALQSTRITSKPVIEPALSAKAFVEALPQEERTRLLAEDAWLPDVSRVPADARARLFALRDAVSSRDAAGSVRLSHFREVLHASQDGGVRDVRDADARLLRAYMRAMRFLYQKEFVAMRDAAPAASVEAVADLYQTRGFSSDTAVEASYGVYVALATAHGLDADWRAQRVLVVGPGLDLAPRTDLIDAFEPQSYQPFLAFDAIVSLGVGDRARLRIDAADINPLVVDVLQRAARTKPLRLFVMSGIAEDARTSLADDYRTYFQSLGRGVGAEEPWPQQLPAADARLGTRLRKALRIAPDAAASISAREFNIVTDRTDTPPQPPYDAIIVTNVFPYLDDKELLLALSNVASLLAPGGFLIHNEPRPLLVASADAFGLPVSQARSVLIATKSNGRHLYDTIWLHRKPR